MKILLAGDSFAADQQIPGPKSWWQMLQDHTVVNIAQPGVGEYKIWQQILRSKLSEFDVVLVCHTSPYRIHAQINPFHSKGSHVHSDLIYKDVEAAPDSPVKEHILYWFQEIMDLDHARSIHGLIKEKIFNHLNQLQIAHCHMTFFDTDQDVFRLDHEINFHKIWKEHSGSINHLSQRGNELVAATMRKVFT